MVRDALPDGVVQETCLMVMARPRDQARLDRTYGVGPSYVGAVMSWSDLSTRRSRASPRGLLIEVSLEEDPRDPLEAIELRRAGPLGKRGDLLAELGFGSDVRVLLAEADQLDGLDVQAFGDLADRLDANAL